MLERIMEIQGIGLLHDANGKPHTCKKATLIYADNGRGKSTLATILRSLSTADPALIANRKTIDGTLAPLAVLQFGSGHKVSFTGNAWSEKRQEILVFDADFVERNVHSGGEVSTGHRKNLLEFALGEQSVAARAAVDIATANAKTTSERVRNLADQLSGHHQGLSPAEFELLKNEPEIEAKSVALQKLLIAATDVASIVSRAVPARAIEPTFNYAPLFEVLQMSLADVHDQAEQVVKAHIQHLGGKNAENWLSQGRQFGDSENCPFCGQKITNNDLIRAYQTHFNAAYSALKSKVLGLSGYVSTATGHGIISVFSQQIQTAAAKADAWKDHVVTDAITFDEQAARTALTAFETFLNDLIRQKQASPADSFGSEADLAHGTALWQTLIEKLQTANKSIEAASAKINAYKGKLHSEDVSAIKLRLLRLQAISTRYSPAVIALFSQLLTARANFNAAELQKKTARESLDVLMDKTVGKYQQSINDLLARFGASFRIKEMGTNYKGAAPRIEYGLLLRGKDVVLDGNPPSFSTTMSEGDKRTLALAFFVATTLQDSNLASRIVVIDDPMCSLDRNRKQYTRTILRKIHSEAAQLIVLAHDPHFIFEVRDTLQKLDKTAPIAIFQLALAANSYTDFAPFDVDKECESAYFSHHRLLNEFSSGSNGDCPSVAKAIRPMLEGYMHRRFPGLINKSLMFGEIVCLIRDAAAPSPLCHAQHLVTELNEINEYAGAFHHDANQSAQATVIVPTELKTYVDKALILVHRGS